MDSRRAKLDRMIRLYAYRQRIPFGVAWNRFQEQFTARCRVNIDVQLNRIRQEKRIPLKKKVSTPQALELIGRLDDALRVADRMLGRKRR